MYISGHDFRSTNGNDAGEDNNAVGYNLFNFDRQYQKNLENAQPNKIEFRFSEEVPAGKYGYALVLTNELVNESSDGQRHFDLIYFQGFHNCFVFFSC